jgi:dipeptidyl aminopeptidase/acylaminoacyl peptidase
MFSRNVGSGLLILFLTLSPATLRGQERGLQPQDYYRLVTVSDVAVSPGGGQVAFTVTRVDEEGNSRRREIWLQELSAGRPEGEPFRITSPTDDASGPVWSPDGSLLGFSSRRGDDPVSVWFLRIGGPGGEAFHIEGVQGTPVWSPDGRWIAYTRAPEVEETGPRTGWVAPDAVSNTLDAERFDGRVVTSIRYKRDGTLTFRPHYATQPKRQLWVVSADGGTPRQITELPFDVGAPVWNPDGSMLFFSGDEEEDDELSSELTSDVWGVPLSGGTVRRLTRNPGSESAPAVGPSGDMLAFRYTSERGAETDLLVVQMGRDGAFQGNPRNLTETWDLVPGSPWFSPDGAHLYFEAGIGGNRHVFRVRVDGGPVEQVTQGDRQIRSVSTSSNGSVMAYSATDAVTPTELYVASGNGSTEQKASGFNDEWLRTVRLMAPEQLSWRVDDGTVVEGWIIPPVGYQPGRSYPMVLKIHGGPHSAYGNTFFPTFHVLSAAGFFVLYPNPRGSANYGHEFMYATRGAWGIVDKEDYLKGVDAALARYPDIDANRLGVSGGSYGGFMTNWLTATSDRFSAAVTSRSITNWESWWGSSDAQGLTEFEFYGTPWERRDLYRRLSPISFVENVTAPTLIIHSENDYRTPIGDGEQWFMSLKKLGVPVEMVRYPRSSHGLSRTGEPWLLVDRLERIRSWFQHWLVDSPLPPRTARLPMPNLNEIR